MFYPKSGPTIRLLVARLIMICLGGWEHVEADEVNGLDFSPYSEKTPWVVSREVIERRTPGSVAETNFEEKLVPSYSLPDLLTFENGGPVATADAWESRRRAELLALFRRDVYGFAPPPPNGIGFEIIEQDSRAIDSTATFKRIRIRFSIGGADFVSHLKLFVPNSLSQPAPVVLVLNHREASLTDETRNLRTEYWPVEYLIGRGYATAALDVAVQFDPDEDQLESGIRAFYSKHDPGSERWSWGTIGAWAWGASRAVDYLVTDATIDRKKIVVIGHSRSGKASLWAGAQDPRFALVIPSNAGDAGPALARRRFGNTIEVMTGRNPHWFTPRYATYAKREADMLVDQHMLIALVAPRGYHAGEGAEDLWADPRGSWLALQAALPAWELFGYDSSMKMPLVNDLLIAGPIAFHIRQGGHGLRLYDWKLYLDHADSLFTKSKFEAAR